MRDAVYHIIRESCQHAHRERTSFLPSLAPRGCGGRVDIVILDAAVGHTLVDIVVEDPTRCDLVERAARQDLIVAIGAERRMETHYWDRAAGTKFVPFAFETYGAFLTGRIDFGRVCNVSIERVCRIRAHHWLVVHMVPSERRLHCNGRWHMRYMLEPVGHY